MERQIQLRGAVAGGAISLLVGVSGIAGWVSGVDALTAGTASSIPIAPSTAGSLALLGVAVLLGTTRRHARVTASLAGLVAANAALRLVTLASGLPTFDPDAWLIGNPEMFGAVPTGRMSPLTAGALAATGAAVMLPHVSAGRLARDVAGMSATGSAWLGLTVVMGYMLGAPLLYGSRVIPMALTTAIGLLAASLGAVLLAGPAALPLRPLSGGSVRARLLRTLVPATIAAFIVSGAVTSLLGRWGVAPAVLAMSAVLVVTTVVIGVIVWVAETLGDAIDRAEEVLQRSRDELDALVRERTAALVEANDALERAKVEADRASAAKNVFLSRMSHDLRTPLNAILGFAQLLEMDPLPDEQRRQVGQILAAGRHLLDLINEVLDIARIESGRLTLSSEPVRVVEFVESTLELVRPLAAQRGISISSQDQARDLHVLADRQRVLQVLINLVSNAIKYNRIGGAVEVAWRAVGDRVRVSVTDTGPGIRPELLPRAFQPFERLDAAQSDVEGTGLGLALVKGLTEAMGGQAGATSEPGRGSTFWIELQAVQAPELPDVAASPADARASADGSRGTVLYVEDNNSNIRLVEHVLARRPGIRLVTTAEGSTVVDVARRERPAVILLDLHLPGVSGEEVLLGLKAEEDTRQIPVVVLTADATPGHPRRLLAAGAMAYLTKPLDVGELLRIVDEVCRPPD